MQHLYKISGKIQPYAWGGTQFIPSFLNQPEATTKAAEYWLGAHPSAPALINGEVNLYNFILNAPQLILGEEVAQKFNELPFLLKVLDVAQMLSIQVHPSKQSAIEGFEKEEQLGIPINAPHRNYKDKNHKPEMMIALSEFWLLHGFKSSEAIAATLKSVDGWDYLFQLFQDKGLKYLYEWLMNLNDEEAAFYLKPIVENSVEAFQQNLLKKSDPAYWVAKAYRDGFLDNGYDKGLFSIYLMNIVCLQPGEAIFQGAGLLHAYLEGQNIEVMANSDNVLRGGLTPKHIDVSELMKHVAFDGIIPQVQQPSQNWMHAFNCPVDDFGISVIQLQEDEKALQTVSAEIILGIDGAAEITYLKEKLNVKKGEAIFIIANTNFLLKSDGYFKAVRAYVNI